MHLRTYVALLIILCLGMVPIQVDAARGRQSSDKKTKEKIVKNRQGVENKSLDKLVGKRTVKVWRSLSKDLGEFLALRSEGVNAITDMKELLKSYRKSLKKAKGIKAKESVVIFHDTYLVYASQGLKGINTVLEGFRNGSKRKRERGWTFVSLAMNDMMAVFDQISGGGSKGRKAGQPIGRSISLNSSVSGNSGAINLNLGLSASFPLNDKVDWGAGFNMDVSGSDLSTSLGLGYDLFLRYNFINFLPNKPWVVPFIGTSIGQKLNSTTDSSGNENSSTTTNLSGSGGFLVFLSRQMALNTELRMTRAGNSDNTGSSSSFSWALTTGLRMSY